MQINENLIKYNFSSRRNTPIQYIVIHDTGNTGYKADSNAHFKYFNSKDRQASAHYFVDDKQVLRVVKDSDKSWHCGDGRGKNGITNENSIGIELCINSDADKNKAYRNLIELTKILMQQYNITLDRVVRHYDASGKICPNTMSKNDWAKWKEFKNDLIKEKKDYSESIKLLYNNLFQRDADKEGLDYWNTKLNEGLTFGDMLKAMGEGEEFEGKYLKQVI